MKFFVVGCNHRTAPIEVRERIAFDPPACSAALLRFKLAFPDAEAVLLSTCNRTELYVARPVHGHPRLDEAIIWLSHRGDPIPHSALRTPHSCAEGLYSHENADLVRHLFRVVAGLDSMVLGESQIVQQVRQALAVARSAGTAGVTLGPLVERALLVARDVRGRTGIGRGRFSVGSVAVDLAAGIFPTFEDKTVLMIGAGKMGELTARHFAGRRPRRLWLTNRTAERAASVAARLGAELRPFDRLDEWVADSDIVVASAAGAAPLLTRDRFSTGSRGRHTPLLLIDLAVPRNIEPGLRECDGMHLYNIDDLQQAAEAHRLRRHDAAAEAERLIDAHVAAFLQEHARRQAGPIVAALRRRFAQIAEQEYDWLMPKLAAAGRPDPELIRQALQRAMNKALHSPSVALNRLAQEGKASAYGEILRKLFVD